MARSLRQYVTNTIIVAASRRRRIPALAAAAGTGPLCAGASQPRRLFGEKVLTAAKKSFAFVFDGVAMSESQQQSPFKENILKGTTVCGSRNLATSLMRSLRARCAGQVALITGGGSGIGFEIARQLGRHGAAVVVMGRREGP
jgi:hypothetical protein